MIWSKRELKPQSDAMVTFDAQTHSDLKALLLTAFAGGVLAFVVAMLMMAVLSMLPPV